MTGLQITFAVFVFFGGLAVLASVLLGAHDLIEWLINRRRA